MTTKTIIENEDDFRKCNRLPDVDGRNLNFINFTFDCDIVIQKGNNNHFTATFEDCIFNKSVKFNTVFEYDVTFRNVVFNGPTSFMNCKFKSKVRFHSVVFKNEVNFDNTKFDNLADFYGSVFYKPVIFYKTDFIGTTVFSRTTFKENVLFTYTLFEKLVIFRGAVFKKGLDLSLSLIIGNINVFDIRLNDFYSKKKIESEDDYEDCVSESGIIPDKNKRETFKLLKLQLQNQGNNIDSLKYANLEIETYRNQLNRELFKEKKIKSTLENYLILALNSLSNKNGKSWSRAILFTILTAVVFFYLAVISTDKYDFEFNFLSKADFYLNMKLFFDFLTPFHKTQFLDEFGTTPITYLIDFIGRALIGYGIYQTIQAFRKYKST